MLRFRKRFTGAPSTLHECNCGLRFTLSQADGRQNIIHELPWCATFERLMRELKANEPDVQLHHATVRQNLETVLLTDGDRIEDVKDPPRPTN